MIKAAIVNNYLLFHSTKHPQPVAPLQQPPDPLIGHSSYPAITGTNRALRANTCIAFQSPYFAFPPFYVSHTRFGTTIVKVIIIRSSACRLLTTYLPR